MAKDQALQFIGRVNEDASLREYLQSFTKDGMEGLVRVGREHGFDFTPEEFQTAAYENWEAQHATAVSEDDLDTIVGGAQKVNPNPFQTFLGGGSFLNGPGFGPAGKQAKF